MRSVRIVSDGTPKGTHIYDAATGARLEGIQSVKLELSLRGTRMRATLTEKTRVDEVFITDAEVADDRPVSDVLSCEGAGLVGDGSGISWPDWPGVQAISYGARTEARQAGSVNINCCGGSGC